MNWLEVAKALPVGQKTRADCPDCGQGTNTNAAIVNHTHKAYSLYCNACGCNPFELKGKLTLQELRELEELNKRAEHEARYNKFDCLPRDFTTEIPIEGRLWLYSAGLSPKDWTRHGIGYSETQRRVILPVYDDSGTLIWQQQRAIFKGQKPKYLQPSREKGSTMLKVSPSGATKERAIVVEDIMSAYRVGKHIPTYSILGTKLSAGQAKTLTGYGRVSTWLDGDRAGIDGAKAIRRAIGLVTAVSNISTESDPKEYSDADIREILCL